MRNPLKNALIAVLLSASSISLRAQEHGNGHIATCSNIQLTARYLAGSTVRGGPAFLFGIHNGSDQAVSLVMPAPTSAHWYAREGSRWSWRASNGAGGSPVDAMNPTGRMFAFEMRAQNAGTSGQIPRKLVVAAHDSRNWQLNASDNPVLNFKPSCTRCNHPTDREFRVVFAYAVLPGSDEPGEEQQGMLRCGLRTRPVAVPASYTRVHGASERRLSPPSDPAALPKAQSSGTQ